MQQPEPPFDPKLRQAMAEIEQVLKKYDVVGFCSLHSKTHGEFIFRPEASWSLIEYNPTPDGRAHLKFKVRPKMQVEMDATAGFVYNGRELAAMFYKNFDLVAQQLEKHATITHTPIAHRINNVGRDVN